MLLVPESRSSYWQSPWTVIYVCIHCTYWRLSYIDRTWKRSTSFFRVSNFIGLAFYFSPFSLQGHGRSLYLAYFSFYFEQAKQFLFSVSAADVLL